MTCLNRRWKLGSHAATVVLLALLVGAGAAVAQPPDLDAIALQIVASRYGIPLSQLAVAEKGSAEFPLQGITATDYKIVDNGAGGLYPVALLADGTEVDGEQKEAQEESLELTTQGTIDPDLDAYLLTVPPSQLVDVLIWLTEPEYLPPPRPDLSDSPEEPDLTEQQVEALYGQADQQRSSFVLTLTGPVLQRLAGFGYAAEADEYAPVVFASLPASAIEEVGSWPEVESIELDDLNQDELSIAVPVVNGHIVHARGILGTGVRVAQIEVGGRVAVANPWLPGVVQDAVNVCAAASGHSTAVAGIIASTHAVQTGTAPGVTLRAGGSCAGNTNQLRGRSTAAANWGARALNLSWGRNTNLRLRAVDRFYDNMVRNRWRTVVKSAGNEAGPCRSGTGNVTSPGLAYNLITVGNVNDQRTVGWLGDAMNVCSSWRDPISRNGDREKPEVAAPGTTITATTTALPWIGGVGSGTSFAAPIVTGGTALLIQRRNFFSIWPESVKALLMTTAVHNIEGAARLSNVDGAGAVVLDRADDVARRAAGGFGGRAYTCASPVNLDVAFPNLVAGVRTRATIAWDTNPGYRRYRRRPSADLDLRVIDPAGNVVSSSLSWDNTYEIVDFTPAVAGVYRLRVRQFRCSSNPQWLGWAWSQ
jgi:hypothetical protein